MNTWDETAAVDAFFAGRVQAWTLFDALSRAVRSAYPGAKLRVMKTCIAFDDLKPFLYVSFPPRKSMQGLWLSIGLREAYDHPRIAMLVPISKTRFTAHIHLTCAQEIDAQLMQLIDCARQ
ncbi:MAG: hypothetical protein IJN79_04415 [Clostridia bacterium]|nr:hypothetical protein [Clostridia bacterium]